MPSTYTVNLGIEKPATGEQSGTWGDTTNTNFDILDQGINGAVRITLTSAGSSGSPNALTITNGAASNGRNKWIEFYSSGDLGGNVFVQLDPNDAEKIVFVRNSLAGSRTVLLFQGTYNSGRDLEVPAGVDMVVKFDGGGASAATVTNVYNNLKVTGLVAGTADINGGTIDGTVIGGAAAAALTATTVVASTSLNIASDGATVTGIKDEDNMSSNSATKLATQQSIKAYVDSQVGTVDTLAEILANGNDTGSNNIDVDGAQKVQFRDSAIFINSSTNGQLDIVADNEIQIAATTIDINGAIVASGDISAASLDISGNVDIDGILNVDAIDIDGAVQLDATLTVGVDDTGYDVKFFGAAGGSFLLWDESANNLSLAGASTLNVAGVVTANAGIVVDNIAIDGNAIDCISGDLTLDVAGDIIFDADGGDVRLKDGGAEFGLLKKDSTRFTIEGPDNPVRIATGTSNIQVNHDTHITFDTAGVEKVRVGTGEMVVNENSADYDFRIESDGNANMLLVNGGNNSVSVGTSTSEATFTVGGSAVFNADSADADFRVESNNSSHMIFVDGGTNKIGINNSSPQSLLDVIEANNVKSHVSARYNTSNRKVGFNVNNSNGQGFVASNANQVSGSAAATYDINGKAAKVDFGNGIELMTSASGSAGATISYVNNLEIDNTASVFNEGGVDIDFRVESNNHDNIFFIDGANDGIGIGNSTIIDWSTNYPGLQMGQAGALYGHKSSNQMTYAMNWGVTTGNSYIANGQASRMVMSSNGDIDFDTSASGSAGGTITGIRTLTLNAASTIFNDGGINQDFRVESNNLTHALFVDASADGVGIGDGSVQSKGLRISSSTGTTNAVDVKLYLNARSSGTTTTGFGPGIVFAGDRNGDSGTQQMAQINAVAEVNSGTTLSSGLSFQTATAGTNSEKMRIQNDGNIRLGNTGDHVLVDISGSNAALKLVDNNQSNPPTIRGNGPNFLIENGGAERVTIDGSGNTVFNPPAVDANFQVKSDANSNMIFVDAGNNRVGIGDNLTNGALTVGTSGVGSYNQITISNTTAANVNKLAGLTTLNYAGDNVSVFQSFNQSNGSNTLYFGSADSSHRGYTTINTFLSSSNTATTNHRKIHTASYSSFVVNEDGIDLDFRVESDNNASMLFVDGGNNRVGVGLSNPAADLEVRGGTTSAIRASGGSNTNYKVEIGYDNSTGPYIKAGSSGIQTLQFFVDNTSLAAKIAGNGDFFTNDGSVSSLSDKRVKTDINDLVDGLDVVKQLKPRTFKYTEDSEFYNESKKDEVSYGFVANEVEEVAPQYTSTGKGKIGDVEVDDLKSLSTTKMIPMLVKAIQEQQTLIETLEARITALES